MKPKHFPTIPLLAHLIIRRLPIRNEYNPFAILCVCVLSLKFPLYIKQNTLNDTVYNICNVVQPLMQTMIWWYRKWLNIENNQEKKPPDPDTLYSEASQSLINQTYYETYLSNLNVKSFFI